MKLNDKDVDVGYQTSQWPKNCLLPLPLIFLSLFHFKLISTESLASDKQTLNPSHYEVVDLSGMLLVRSRFDQNPVSSPQRGTHIDYEIMTDSTNFLRMNYLHFVDFSFSTLPNVNLIASYHYFSPLSRKGM